MPILFIRPLLLKAHPIYKGRSTNAITFIKLLDKGNPFHKATQQQKNQKKSDSSIGAQEVILLQDKYTCFTIPVEVW
jgi:hypothetical protein